MAQHLVPSYKLSYVAVYVQWMRVCKSFVEGMWEQDVPELITLYWSYVYTAALCCFPGMQTWDFTTFEAGEFRRKWVIQTL